MAAAPKDANDLYAAARADLGAPDRDKALKWVVWTAGYFRQVTIFQGRVASAETTDRAAALRGEAPVADACNDLLATWAELHSIAAQVRDMLTAVVTPTLRVAAPAKPAQPPLRAVPGGKR